MIQWAIDNWPALAPFSGAAAAIGAAIRFGPRCLRRLLLMLDCETDRLRWQEADTLRNRELELLRRQVGNLQADMDRLLDYYAPSGGASAAAPSAKTTPRRTPSLPPSAT